jgi:hypothetical protein
MFPKNLVWFFRGATWPIWIVWLSLLLTYDSLFTGNLKWQQKLLDRWNSAFGLFIGGLFCVGVNFALESMSLVVTITIYMLSGALLGYPKTAEYLCFKLGKFGIHQWGLGLLGILIGSILG